MGPNMPPFLYAFGLWLGVLGLVLVILGEKRMERYSQRLRYVAGIVVFCSVLSMLLIAATKLMQ